MPPIVFIHSSIKTRIETREIKSSARWHCLFLYIVPLKQGLKLRKTEISNSKRRSFYT